jgi:hypothetical protein
LAIAARAALIVTVGVAWTALLTWAALITWTALLTWAAFVTRGPITVAMAIAPTISALALVATRTAGLAGGLGLAAVSSAVGNSVGAR